VKFHRHAGGAPSELARSAVGTTVALKTDEVSRHAVRLVVIDRATDNVRVTKFASLPCLLGPGDLLVVNDAATLPGSLRGTTEAGAPFELRLSRPVEGTTLWGVAFGPGDHRTRTEDRLAPPPLGTNVTIAGLPAAVVTQDGRRVELTVRADEDRLWQALYTHGRAIQYAHRREQLPLYAVQTAYAARPWAAEMPSAGRPLTWDVLLELRRRGVEIARLTHAAGLSSTGDDALDRALPWPERYEIPRETLAAVGAARRVIAVGTTVVRALESWAQSCEAAGIAAWAHSAAASGIARQSWAQPGAASGIARLKLDPQYRPRVVAGLISGLHAPGESHFELLSAFAPRERLVRAIELAAAQGLSGHELGDACLVL
jgi:S-adenosylmethionine:tRNA ribosyltransferase-isomerase